MELADKDFHHPYTPYEIQLQFMKALYTCIEQGKIGIFESPTGTEKSLSLICGSLTWLRDHKRGQFLNTAEDGDLDDEPQWMLEHTQRQRKKAAAEKIKDLESRLAKIRKEEERQRRRFEEHGHLNKKRKLNTNGPHEEKEPESFFELDDYESDVETGSSKPAPKGDDNLSSDTLALLEKLRGGVTNIPDAEQEGGVQIFYCSRTHSQLTQFAHELRRVKLPPSVPIEVECESGTEQNKPEKTLEEGMKHVSLGSRKNLCVNPKVQALNNATAINERCLDLQKPGVSSDHKCPYLPNKDNEVLINDFRDHTLAKVRDIEDIGKIGSKLGICPYYASRSVIKDSEIVTLPYPLLLQRSAREALNISLKNHVIIIDEAHNLVDAISNIHSVTLSLTQLNTALSQLTIYARKYKSRLKGKNRVYVTQVIRLVSSIADYLKKLQATNQPTEGSIIFSDIMKGNNVDQINPHKLSRYLHESKLARKIDGYIEFSKTTNNEGQSAARQSVPVLFQVQSFLLALMNPSAEGRLFFEKLGNNIILKYMLLDPTNHFREIAEDARAVILAGGTMSPMGDYADQLFSYLEPGRLQTFSYGHVIPRDNLIVTPVMNATSTTSFDFTYEKRNSESMILDLGKTVMDICRVTPDGVVAFFPSYDYLNHVLAVWRKRSSTAQASTFRSMELIKTVLHESQDKATNSDNLLQNYSDAIKEGKGALLLAVMGGKLSEGINFSNELGRGVIVVGLPFPNARSAVWQTKIEHVERRAYDSCIGTEDTKKAKSKAAGREFYENSCMRTVNQCIGRAIRHQNDYAAIILMDRRYSTPRIQSKLPGWIRQSIVPGVAESFSERGIKDLSAFFHEKRSIDPTKNK